MIFSDILVCLAYNSKFLLCNEDNYEWFLVPNIYQMQSPKRNTMYVGGVFFCFIGLALKLNQWKALEHQLYAQTKPSEFDVVKDMVDAMLYFSIKESPREL
jgi:hypothetical protein